MVRQQGVGKLEREAGIAIGPILFIVAILAILAAAIAAGSGSFTSSTTTESARTKASALIQIGENLKVGMDRITMTGGYDPTNTSSMTMDPSKTANANDLFAPTGGGIAPPSTAMSNQPGTDVWYFVTGPVKGFGGTGNEVFAVIKVTSSVCAEINNRTMGTSLTPNNADLGNFASNATTAATSGTNWPSATNATSVMLNGVSVGCVNNANTGSNGNYFYEILYVQ